MFSDYSGKNFSEMKRLLDVTDQATLGRIVDLFDAVLKKGKTVYIIGNGGSAATASHWANDLGKGAAVEGHPRFKVISLCDNISTITAIANDLSYDDIFIEQLKNLLEADDLVVGISCSGNSENVVRALTYATERGAKTVGLLGFGGGKMRSMVDEELTVDSYDYGLVESAHMFYEHVISFYFKARFEAEG